MTCFLGIDSVTRIDNAENAYPVSRVCISVLLIIYNLVVDFGFAESPNARLDGGPDTRDWIKVL